MKYYVPLFFIFAALAANSTYAATETGDQYVYRSVNQRSLRLWVVDATPQRQQPAPAIVLFHGGGWVAGSPSSYDELATYLSSLGVTCILVEYRLLSDNNELPSKCIEDAMAAMRWTREHSAALGIDENRIAAGGDSAGGHLAAAIATIGNRYDPDPHSIVSPRPDALILINPVLDNGPLGYGHKRIGDKYPDFSPAHNISPGLPPSLVLLGSEDKIVPVSILKAFERRMVAAGNRCELEVFPGMPHSFFHRNYGGVEGVNAAQHAIRRFLTSLDWIPHSVPGK